MNTEDYQRPELVAILRSIATVLSRRDPLSRLPLKSPDFDTGSIGHVLHRMPDEELIELAVAIVAKISN